MFLFLIISNVFLMLNFATNRIVKRHCLVFCTNTEVKLTKLNTIKNLNRLIDLNYVTIK